MTATLDFEFLTELISIANIAGTKIMPWYQSTSLKSSQKSDSSPITAADEASHNYLASMLPTLYRAPILSEEGLVEWNTRSTWGEHWLIDPLDGTKDFIAGNGEFTVNCALIRDNRAVLGVVHCPALHLTYGALEGSGAWRQSGTTRDKIQVRSPQYGSLSSAESRFHPAPQSAEFCKRLGIKTVQNYGSALKLCRVAEGSVDLYPRFGPTSEWDIAAGHCIVREAGGEVYSSITGNPLIYGKENILNDPFIVCHPTLAAEALQIMQDVF